MKKIFRNILLLTILFPLTYTLSAQEYKARDMIDITPLLPSDIDLPSAAQKSLNLKLRQMVTQNGFGSYSNQFVLTGDMAILDKQATSTAPVQYVVEVELSLYVVNVVEQVIVDEISFVLKAVDRVESKAISQAINQVNPRSPKVRAFMERSREKIIEYYNTRIPAIINKARSLSDRGEYAEALYILAAVPEMVDQYGMVSELMTSVYHQKIDLEGQAALNRAKGEIALKDYGVAVETLAGVNPASKHSDEAVKLLETVGEKIEEKDQRDFDVKMMAYKDKLELYKRDQELSHERILMEANREEPNVMGTLLSLLNGWFRIMR